MSAEIALQGVWQSFPGKARGASIPVLEDIELTVPAGAFVCLVGPSGCGKSTLLNIAAGFLPASRGEIRIDGEPVRGPHPRRLFIFQESSVFPWLTVAQNIAFGLTGSAEERRGIVADWIARMGLAGFEAAYPRQLSGGMKQRVEIARALACRPDVLFLDEPFGALDYLTRLRLRAELIDLWQRERPTVLFVTHDVDEAVQLADCIVVLSPRPARLRRLLPVDLPRPRDLDAPAYLALRDQVLVLLGVDLAV
ncbi:MAG TPA: ABC transporter ATP-binding protein [Thermoanaerobaculia bacterium]|nr:ABC transporter ATP-binding protein [Thermoanaerobaculia bacterium]